MNVLRHSTEPASIESTRPDTPSAAGPSALGVECVGIACLAGHVAAWADLCARALEPNVFLDPAFALPLFQHDGQAGSPRFLLVWEEDGPATFGRLLGFFVLALPSRRGGTARVIIHKQTAIGTPLVDRDTAADVIDVALTWLAGRSAALVVSETDRDGPFAVALRQVCASSVRPLAVLDERTRAVLTRQTEEDDRVASFASARRRKQYARQARRLARKGERKLTSTSTPTEVAAATERFLALEQASWKGARGTALLARPGLATFARTMTRLMTEGGRCRIDSVEIDGRSVAMGIILTDRGRAHFWKIAFDETYALFSPGVQLALELTNRQLADPSVLLTDSCAEPNNPMIDRIWPDRIVMADLMIATAPGGGRAFERRLRVERLRRTIRQSCKALWLRFRRAPGIEKPIA